MNDENFVFPDGPSLHEVEVIVTEPEEVGVLFGPKGEVLVVVTKPRVPFGFGPPK